MACTLLVLGRPMMLACVRRGPERLFAVCGVLAVAVFSGRKEGDRHRGFWFVGLIEVRFFGFVFGRRFGDARGWCSVLHACSSYRLKSITFAWYGEQSTQGVCICMYQYH